MITTIEHCGVLVHECKLPGETRGDDVFPAHCNAIPLSRTRWLVLYATRGFNGIDDDRSIVYQVRENAPDGAVLRENFLSRCVDDWQPHNDGKIYRKEHGHPVAFGVPRGALIGGKRAPNENVFVAKWRVLGKTVEDGKVSRETTSKTQGAEWVQFRLNEAGDDIEILQAPQPLRQLGFECGDNFCARDVTCMNQTFVNAIPLSDDGTRWGDVNHFDDVKIAALEYSFNATRGLYEWSRTGPLLGGASTPAFEASLAKLNDQFIIGARRAKGDGSAWWRFDDLFDASSAGASTPILTETPPSYAPQASYVCADGVLRLLTGDPQSSPYNNGRNPLFIWDAGNFEPKNQRVLFDAWEAGLPIRPEAGTVVDMAKILPHTGGSTQFFVHRVRPKAINFPANTKAVVNAQEKNCAAIYYGVIHYEREYSGAWQWDNDA
jgi:hypothetical protein